MQGYNENDYKPFVIFTLRDLDEGSYRLAHMGLILKSRGINHKIVKSNFNGSEKTCILATLEGPNTMDYIKDLVFKDGQESLFVVTSQRNAFIMHNHQMAKDPERIHQLGKFKYVTPEQAKACDIWALDNGDYYACV